MEPPFEKFYLESLLKIFVPQFIYQYFDRRQGVLSLFCVCKLRIFCMYTMFLTEQVFVPQFIYQYVYRRQGIISLFCVCM
jgi:hypothetical protein